MSREIAVERTKNPKALPAPETFGFGRFFSDHMLTMHFSQAKGWEPARITPYQPLPIDPGASALHYGQALFEGMKAFRGVDGRVRLFRPHMNWQRMREGALRLCMQSPDVEDFINGLVRFVETEDRWVPDSAGTALYLRPTLIGTEGFLGVRPAENFLFFVIGSPVGNYYGANADTVKIWIEETYSRAAPGGIGAVKAGGNYASSLLAATEAKKQGYSQVLWLDAAEKKYVEEVGTMNVFFKIKDKVLTPQLGGTILPGVTRDSVIELLREKKVDVEVRAVELSEIIAAHQRGDLNEVFGTGTAANISPVGALGYRDRAMTVNHGAVGPLAQSLMQTLGDIQYGRVADHRGWTVTVPNSAR